MPDRYYRAEAVRVSEALRRACRAQARWRWGGALLAAVGVVFMAGAVVDAGIAGTLLRVLHSGTWWLGTVAWATGLVVASSLGTGD